MQFPSSAADCDCRPQVCQLNYCYELFTVFSYSWCSARAPSARGTPLLSTIYSNSELNPGEVRERRRLLTKGSGYSAFTPDIKRRNS